MALTIVGMRGGLVGAVDIERAFDAWSDFPIDAARRPIVRTGPMVLGPQDGFRTTELKEAFCSGDYVHPPSLPDAVPRSQGFAIIDAEAGLARLEADGDHQGSPAPLQIRSLELRSAMFETDRGRVELPAWLISFDKVAHPAPVLALDPSEMFPHPSPPPQLGARFSVRPGPDPRTVEVCFVGGPPQSTSYAADAVEAPHAIAIQVRQLPGDPPSGRSGRHATRRVGYGRTTLVRLAEPVGDRVLIDPYTWAPAPFAP